MTIFFLLILMINIVTLIFGSETIIDTYPEYKKIFFSTTITMIIISIIVMPITSKMININPESDENKKSDESVSTATLNFDKTDSYETNQEGSNQTAYGFDSNKNGKFTITFYTKNNESIRTKQKFDDTSTLKESNGKNKLTIHLTFSEIEETCDLNVTAYKSNYKAKTVRLSIYNRSYNNKKNKTYRNKLDNEFNENNKKIKSEEQSKKQRYQNNHPLFENEFPGSLTNYSSNDLFNHSVRFTGEVYGLGTDKFNHYIAVLKNSSGQLMFVNVSNKKVVD